MTSGQHDEMNTRRLCITCTCVYHKHTHTPIQYYTIPQSGRLVWIIRDAHPIGVSALTPLAPPHVNITQDSSTITLLSGGADGTLRLWEAGVTHQTLHTSIKVRQVQQHIPISYTNPLPHNRPLTNPMTLPHTPAGPPRSHQQHCSTP